jgi:hypothetical protein
LVSRDLIGQELQFERVLLLHVGRRHLGHEAAEIARPPDQPLEDDLTALADIDENCDGAEHDERHGNTCRDPHGQLLEPFAGA